MSMTISIRLEHKNMHKSAGQRRHDARLGVVPAYVDRSKSELNSNIIPHMMESEAKRQCVELRNKSGKYQREMKSTAAVTTAGVITFGKEAQPTIEALSPEKQDELYQDVAQAIADKLNTRLISLTVHRDETAPHAHFSLLAVNKDGITLSKVVQYGMAAELQTLAGEVMKKHELDITRGKSKWTRLAEGEPYVDTTHKSVQELHRSIPADIEKARQRKLEADREAEEAEAKMIKNQRLADAAQAKLDAGKGDLDKLEKNLGIYRNREAAAKADIDRLKNEQEQLDQDINRKQALLKAIRENMPELKGKSTLIGNSLKVSGDELSRYNDEVAEYIQAEASKRTKEQKKQLQQHEKDLTAREQALVAKEGTLVNREDELEKWSEALATREKRLDGYDQVVTENQRLKNRMSTIGLHIGKVLGIENAGMNGGKILNAMESSFSMAEFQKNLQAQKLRTHDSGLTVK